MARANQRYGRKRRQNPFAFLKVPLVILGILGACSLFYVIIASPPEQGRAAAPTATPLTLSQSNPQLGEPDAPVRFFLYCDLGGPECAKFHEKVEPNLRKEFVDSGKVAIVFRNTPQNRLPASKPAALAGLCAHGQGSFWEMYTYLLENQPKWRVLSVQRDGDALSKVEQKFVEFAGEIGIDSAAFEQCMQEQKFLEQLNKDIAAAKEANANNAYAFRINQRPAFAGFRDYDFVKDVIQSEL